MVKVAASLVGVLLLASCASGGAAGPSPADDRAGSENVEELGELEPFDPAESLLEREISEDLRAGAPASHGEGPRAERPMRVSSRAAADGGGAAESAKDNEHVAVDAGSVKCRVRRKGAEGLAVLSWYGRLRIRDGGIELHAGSFLPDLDGGLAAGGARSPYVFSSSFPIEEPRGVVPQTSFYGRSLVGGALTARRGRARLTMLGGRERVDRRGRPFLTSIGWAGGRIEVPVGPVRCSAWGIGGSKGAGAPVIGAGIQAATGLASLRMEGAGRRGGAPGAMAALALRTGSTRAGAIAYSLGCGGGGPFARIGGSDLAASSSHAGAAAAIERRLSRPFRARISAEWRARSSDDTEATRTRLRGEIEGRSRRVRLALVWILTDEERGALVPVPRSGDDGRTLTHSIGGTAWVSPFRQIEARMAARNLSESGGGSARLLSSSASLFLFSRSLRFSLFHSLCAARGPAPACFIYEPSLSSAYPWRYVAPGRQRYGVLIVSKFNWLELSCKVAFEVPEMPSWACQAATVF